MKKIFAEPELNSVRLYSERITDGGFTLLDSNQPDTKLSTDENEQGWE